jgi:hypothetical protein
MSRNDEGRIDELLSLGISETSGTISHLLQCLRMYVDTCNKFTINCNEMKKERKGLTQPTNEDTSTHVR